MLISDLLFHLLLYIFLFLIVQMLQVCIVICIYSPMREMQVSDFLYRDLKNTGSVSNQGTQTHISTSFVEIENLNHAIKENLVRTF